MAKQEIHIGSQSNDGTGDSIRHAFIKVNSNFTELYSVFGVSGTIRFTDLDDTAATYAENQIIMAKNNYTVGSTEVTSLAARTLLSGDNSLLIDTDTDATLDIQINPTLEINSLRTTILTAGSAVDIGTITGQWSLSPGSTLESLSADLAEYYTSDESYSPGTVVIFGGSKEVTISTRSNDSSMAGVVSSEPAYILNSSIKPDGVCIALVGRVPCKVIGRVKKGDLLTTSNVPGHAMKCLNPSMSIGSIIGKAITDKETDDAGVIEISVIKS